MKFASNKSRGFPNPYSHHLIWLQDPIVVFVESVLTLISALEKLSTLFWHLALVFGSSEELQLARLSYQEEHLQVLLASSILAYR
jgi:hypothetical protein